MKKKFITVHTTHYTTQNETNACDYYESDVILPEHSDMSVTNVIDTIVEDVFKTLPHSGKESLYDKEGLRNAFEHTIANGNPIQWGNATSSITYNVKEIEEENVRYLPVCSIRISSSPIIEEDILLAQACASYEECKWLLDEAITISPKQKYENGFDIPDTFHIYVVDITKINERSWYKDEVTRIGSTDKELMDKYQKEYNEDEGGCFLFEEYVFMYHTSSFDRLFPDLYEKNWKPELKNESELVEQDINDELEM